MLRAIGIAALVATSVLMAGQPAAAEKTRLFFTSLSPAGSNNTKFFTEWANRANAAANGTIDVVIKDGLALANFGNVYDRVLDDVVQIGWGQQSFIRGRFPLSEVVGLPFLVTDNVVGSIAFWRLYDSGLLKSEYTQVVPLWLGLLGASGLHFAKAPATLDNFHGLKIRVNGKVPSDVVTRLGGTPISLAGGAMYEALQRGTIDGVDTSWAAFEPYRLYEVTSYHVEAPLGSAPCMFFMARKKMGSLPAVAQKALTETSGEAQSRAFGYNNEAQANRMVTKVRADAKQKVVALDAARSASWQKRTAPVIEAWEKDTKDGAKIVSEFRKIYEGAKSAK